MFDKAHTSVLLYPLAKMGICVEISISTEDMH